VSKGLPAPVAAGFIVGIMILLFSTQSTSKTYAAEETVFFGKGSLVDGHYVSHNENLKASWKADSFVMYSNGTFSLDLELKYLSENPTMAKVYRSDKIENQDETVATNLHYVDSFALVQIAGDYVYVDDWLDGGEKRNFTDVIPIRTVRMDDQNSTLSYAGYFTIAETPPDYLRLNKYIIELSWVRIFKDETGNIFYQWLQSDDYCSGTGCPSQVVPLDESHEIAGSFLVYYPLPQEFTRPEVALGFDYVQWSKNNVLSENPPTPEQLQECQEAGIRLEECSEENILKKRTRDRKPPISDEEWQRIVEQEEAMTNSLWLVGIGATIAGTIAFITLRRTRK
jgi:hypothetical protein